ncbi:polysaccharide biosynthesis/export family protein [Caldimonas tepidiphila]|uniref:polysaccharide biosynthesis/export family protein n=1 Tax=Caldimonas tepidiphila TaxID=2315841 RepID=UPI000E5C0773|nr:polysaccharide biosynthesis/export family protein [Caldimonas tepidiphila]
MILPSFRPAPPLAALLLALAGAAQAQFAGLELPDAGLRGLAAQPAAAPSPARSAVPPPAAASSASPAPSVLPPDPATSARPLMFGSQIFIGRFSSETFSGYNPDHQISVGDRVSVRMWGAFTFDGTQPVDAQGNIFIPNVGPVNVLGVRNADLHRHVEVQVKRTFRSNVGLYASLEAAQPVKVYVTGFVRAPGLYGGLSSDSVLHYLDRAGGIDPDRGSYLAVDVLRGGRSRGQFNLYRFLLEGRIEPLQLQDGDTIVVAAQQSTVRVSGEVQNPYVFEFGKASLSGTELLAMARPRPAATHMSIVRKVGAERRSEYHPLSDAARVTIENGDEVSFTADKFPGTILVRLEGAHLGERTVVLPYGATLRQALERLKPAPQANLASVQLFRRSVAERQKEMLNTSLRSLETYALTGRSSTSEEAALRNREAELIMQFVERARSVQPRGQVVLSQGGSASETLLEDGDVIRVPERSNLVLISGEVVLPNALVYDERARVADYVRQAGGYTQKADNARVVVMRQDGSVASGADARLLPGDEIIVMPRIDTKSVEVARGLTQIVYQIAIAAKVLLGL